MGIYSNVSIFGIRIYIYDNDDSIDTLFEKKYHEIMNHKQMSEAYLFYSQLNNKNKIHFQIYTDCSRRLSYNRDNFIMWQPLPLNTFLEKFGV